MPRTASALYRQWKSVAVVLVSVSLLAMLWSSRSVVGITAKSGQFNQSSSVASSNRSIWRQLPGNASNASVETSKILPSAERYNALESERLVAYLLAVNGSLRINGVITILANLPRLNALRECLKLLYNNFYSGVDYPVIIYHESNFRSGIQQVRSLGVGGQRRLSSIFFQEIDMSVPDWQIARFGQPPKDVCGTSKSIGYRSMCRFQAKLVYLQPIMRQFDYHWRLDDDSLITAKMPYDPFAVLKDGGYSYSFFQSMVDECADTTYNVTVDYMMSRKVRPTFFGQLKHSEVFFNNFEVSSMKVWLSEQYRDYVDYMDSLGGFYTRRWGDAPIKTLALSMFVPLREIHRWRNLPYSHHSLHSSFKTRFLDQK